MNKQSILFSANEQTLEKTSGIDNYASNTVSYIEATFALGENWTGYDVVRAVWESRYARISTVLDSNYKCIVPTEVLKYKSKVNVNLVGSIMESEQLTDRITTHPILALTVDADARVDSSETQPLTPSQFEQFVATVHEDAESIQNYSYDSEAWAKGTRGGVPVPSTDETYQNNSKYYADQSAELQQEVTDLKNDLDNLVDALAVESDNTYPSAWEQGYIASSGAIGNDPNTCTTRGYIKLGDRKLILTAKDGYKFAVGDYSTNGISGYIGRVFTGYLTEYTFVPQASHYYKISIARTNTTALTPSQIPDDALWYYSEGYTDETLSMSGKPADAKIVGDTFADERQQPLLNMRSQQNAKVLFDMQSGHGFYNPLAVGDAPSDDTTDFIFGTQSVKFHYAGKASFSPLDLSESVIEVKIKINSIDSGASINMYLTNDNTLTNCCVCSLYKNTPSNQFEAGVWRTVSVAIGAGRVVGEPDLENAKYIQFGVANGVADYNIQSISYRAKGKQHPCISFTFDDVWSEVMLGAKILGKYGIPATAYIFTGCELSTNQLLTLKNDYGWDIELHGDSVFTEMTAEELDSYIQEQQNFVRSNGLGEGLHMAYPGGQNNKDVVNVLRKFCKTGRTINSDAQSIETIPSPLPYNLRALSGIGSSGSSVATVKSTIDKAVASNGWAILVFHRIGDTATSMFCSESDLEEIAEYAVASGADIKTVDAMWERN